jgi:hypothetical protein
MKDCKYYNATGSVQKTKKFTNNVFCFLLVNLLIPALQVHTTKVALECCAFRKIALPFYPLWSSVPLKVDPK